jgi:uncharacterized Zn finger protein
MKVAKLTEEQLRQDFAPEAVERAEGSVGQFFDCLVKNGDLHGKIRGNHGSYEVSLHTSKDTLSGQCECKASETGLCKHTAALGLSYIYTPWIFKSADKIDRKKLQSMEEIQFYIAITPLKSLLDELKEKRGVGLARFAELTKMPMQHLMQVIKNNEAGIPNSYTEMVKLSSMYLMDKDN